MGQSRYSYGVRRSRALFACLLALVLLGESSGLARAFGPGTSVRCCCGEHQVARPCHCPSCPATRSERTSLQPEEQHLCAGRDCNGDSLNDPGVLRVLAPALERAALVFVPLASAHEMPAAPLPLRGRILELNRPPP